MPPRSWRCPAEDRKLLPECKVLDHQARPGAKGCEDTTFPRRPIAPVAPATKTRMVILLAWGYASGFRPRDEMAVRNVTTRSSDVALSASTSSSLGASVLALDVVSTGAFRWWPERRRSVSPTNEAERPS